MHRCSYLHGRIEVEARVLSREHGPPHMRNQPV